MNRQNVIIPKAGKRFVKALKRNLLAASICTVTSVGPAAAFGTIDPAGVTNSSQVRNHLINVARDNYLIGAANDLRSAQSLADTFPFSNQAQAEIARLIDTAEANLNAADTLVRLGADLSMDVQDFTVLGQAFNMMDAINALKNQLIDEAYQSGVRQIAEAENVELATVAQGSDSSTLEVTVTEDSGDTIVMSIDQQFISSDQIQDWNSFADRNADGSTTLSTSSSSETITFSPSNTCTSGCGSLSDPGVFPTDDSYSSTAEAVGFGGYGGGVGSGGTGGYGGGGSGGGVWGDPHFIDLTNSTTNPHERNFDVMGEAGKVFNVLSDQRVQLNNLYKSAKTKDMTIVGAVGIKLLDDAGKIHRIRYAVGSVPTLDGKIVKENRQKTFAMQGKIAGVAYDGRLLTIDTPEYKLSFAPQTDASIDERVQIQAAGVLTDNVPPHGLLGQTADGDSNIRLGRTGAGAQGEGAIDFSYQKYQVADLFADPDADINRFQMSTTLSFDNGGIARIVHAATGKLLATTGTDGRLVSVRYQNNEDGTETLTLADGKTPIDRQGKLLAKKTNLVQLNDGNLLAAQ